MRKNGYRVFKCPVCGFEADRDMVAILNIGRKAIKKMGVSDYPDCPSNDRCRPE